MDRVENLLNELATRHRNSDLRFMAAVRPMVQRILDPAIPDEARVPLLEHLAETFERDAQVRNDLASAKRSWDLLTLFLRRRFGGEHA